MSRAASREMRKDKAVRLEVHEMSHYHEDDSLQYVPPGLRPGSASILRNNSQTNGRDNYLQKDGSTTAGGLKSGNQNAKVRGHSTSVDIPKYLVKHEVPFDTYCTYKPRALRDPVSIFEPTCFGGKEN